MTERTAHVITCDDLRLEVGGKFFLVGMYTGNITIPSNEFVSPQLVFLFLVTTEIDDPYQTLTCEVTLPGADTVRREVRVVNQPANEQLKKLGARKRIHRIPVFMQGPVLREGRIEAKIVHEKGDLPVIGMPFIVRMPDQSPKAVAG